MKLSTRKSKAVAVLLTAAIILSGIFVAPNTAKAADDYNTLLNEEGNASASTPISYNFNVPVLGVIEIDLLVPAPVGLTINVSSSGYQEQVTISSDKWYDMSTYYYYPLDWSTASTGDHTISLTFDADTEFVIYAAQKKLAASFNISTLSLTKGFSQKLTVNNGSVNQWSSSNSKVAAVDSNGKVTGKSAGTATITATTTDGQTLTCSVNVLANTYKGTAGSPTYGNVSFIITKMSYNKKGDLVIKATCTNNCGHKISKLMNVKITAKNSSNKVIGTYTIKSQKVSILQGGQKTFTYTIKKAKLKQKKTQDLRNASANINNGAKYK